MLEIRITAPELSEAINGLARAMSARAETTLNGTKVCAVPTNATCAGAEPQAQASVPRANTSVPPVTQQFFPTAQPSTVTPVEPVAPVASSGVPTAEPRYTLEMIARAGTSLVDAGRIDDVTALLARYGVNALTALDPSQYGSMAMDLRALGAQI